VGNSREFNAPSRLAASQLAQTAGLIAATLALVTAGCKASVQAEAKVNARADVESDQDKAAAAADRSSGFGAEDEEEVGSDQALPGARLDLEFAPENPTPNCECLAVAVGQPTDTNFAWQVAAPSVDAARYVVLAFSAEGIACPRAQGKAQGPSYWGYEAQGENVIVYVENAAVGRPQARGAIIPRPAGGGRLLVKPRSNAVPYGRGPSGTPDACDVTPR
jgi:hypothetical protein